MKRLVQILCLGALCVAPLAACGQGTFELAYADFEPTGHALAMQTWQWRLTFQKGHPDDKLPEGVSLTDLYCCGIKPFGGSVVTFLLDLSGQPTLYVDTDADLDLSDEQAMVAVQVRGARSAWFGPFDVAAGRDRRIARQRLALVAGFGPRGEVGAYLVPGGAHSGRARLGDTEYAIAVADNDMSGRCDDVFELVQGRIPKTKDSIAIDLDGDGRFEHGASEVMPLGRIVRVGDAYYSVEVSPDGSSITFGTAAVRCGAFKATGADASFRVWSDAGVFDLTRSNREGDGTWRLPAGVYVVGAPALMRTDDAGDIWTLSCRGLPIGSQFFSIVPGKTRMLSFGGPLRFEVAVDMQRSNVCVGLELRGQGGESYQAGACKNGRLLAAPTYKIIDGAGNELASAKFEYG
jgi:hypothetical protein